MHPHLTAASARLLADDAIDVGVPEAVVWEVLGTRPDRLDSPGHQVSATRSHALIETMIDLAGDDAYLRARSSRRFSDLGPLGYLVATYPDVRAGLRQALHYLPTFASDLVIQMEDVEDGHGRVTISSPCPPRRGLHARIAGTMGLILTMAAPLTGTGWVPLLAQLPGTAPATELRRRLFGPNLRSGGDIGVLLAPAGVLDRRLDRSDPDIAAYFERELETRLRALQSISGPDSFVPRARMAIAEQLQSGATVAGTARLLGMSTRTLQRRLAQRDLTFHEVREQVRRELAMEWLGNGMPIAEASFALGYSEPSAFHRAFKRWTGSTPGQWEPVRP